jgi:hypothetical protein
VPLEILAHKVILALREIRVRKVPQEQSETQEQQEIQAPKETLVRQELSEIQVQQALQALLD